MAPAAQDAQAVVCSCGASIASQHRFCRKCGARKPELLADKVPAEDPQAVVCSCGNVIESRFRFCKRCGTRKPEKLAEKADNGDLPQNISEAEKTDILGNQAKTNGTCAQAASVDPSSKSLMRNLCLPTTTVTTVTRASSHSPRFGRAIEERSELHAQFRCAEITLDLAKSELQQEMLKTQQVSARAADCERQVAHFMRVVQEVTVAKDRECKSLAADLMTTQQGTAFAAEKADMEEQRRWLLEQRMHSIRHEFMFQTQKLKCEQEEEVQALTREVCEYQRIFTTETALAEEAERQGEHIRSRYTGLAESKSSEMHQLQEEVMQHQQGLVGAERARSEADFSLSALQQELAQMHSERSKMQHKMQQESHVLMSLREECMEIQQQHRSEEIKVEQHEQRGRQDRDLEEQRQNCMLLIKRLADHDTEFDRDHAAFQDQLRQHHDSHQQTLTTITRQYDEDRRSWEQDMSTSNIEEYAACLEQKEEEHRQIEAAHVQEIGALDSSERDQAQQVMELRSQLTLAEQNHSRTVDESQSLTDQIRTMKGTIQEIAECDSRHQQMINLRQDLASENATYESHQLEQHQERMSWETKERQLQSSLDQLLADDQIAQGQAQQLEMQLQVLIRKIESTQIRVSRAELDRAEIEGKTEHRYEHVVQMRGQLQRATESRTEAICQKDALLTKLKYIEDHTARIATEAMTVCEQLMQVRHSLRHEPTNMQSMLQSERSEMQQSQNVWMISEEPMQIHQQHWLEEIKVKQQEQQRGRQDGDLEDQRQNCSSLEDHEAEIDLDHASFQDQLRQLHDSHQQPLTTITIQSGEDKMSWEQDMSSNIEEYAACLEQKEDMSSNIEEYAACLEQKEEEHRQIEVAHVQEIGALDSLERDQAQQVMELRSQLTLAQQNHSRTVDESQSLKDQIRTTQGAIETEQIVTSNEMKEIDAINMTVPADDDSVDVYYLMSPLMMEQVGDLGSFHSSAAFIHKNTDVHVSVQFCANSFGVSLLLPSVDHDTEELNNSDGAKLKVHEGKLDFRYWRHCQKLATIKGADYIKFIEWMKKEVNNYSKYTLAHLRATGDRVVQPFLQTWSGDSGKIGSMTCFDACQTVLQAVKDIAGIHVFTADPATVFRNDLYFWVKPGTEPTKLDMTSGSLDQQRAFVFYETMLDALGSFQGLDVFNQIGIEIGKSELTYAVYCDANGNLWEYTPDSIPTSIAFDQEELKRLLPLLGTGAP